MMTPAEPPAANEAAKEISLDPPALKDSPQRWGLAALLVVAMLFCYAQRNALNVAATSMSETTPAGTMRSPGATA